MKNRLITCLFVNTQFWNGNSYRWWKPDSYCFSCYRSRKLNDSASTYCCSFRLINPTWRRECLNFELIYPLSQEGYFNRQTVKINEKFQKDQSGTIYGFFDAFIHSFPKMLIISLPFMALIMQLMYLRRKEISFVGHLVYVIQLYVFSFLASALNMILTSIGDIEPLGFVHWIAMAVLIWILYYGYKSMKNFYGGRRLFTVIRYGISLFLSSFIFLILFIGYTLISFLFL